MVPRPIGEPLEVGSESSIDFVVDGPRLTARLDEILAGRKLRFAVEVTAEDGRTIGVGRHERRVVKTGASRR